MEKRLLIFEVKILELPENQIFIKMEVILYFLYS
jgi:hypothetical protein